MAILISPRCSERNALGLPVADVLPGGVTLISLCAVSYTCPTPSLYGCGEVKVKTHTFNTDQLTEEESMKEVIHDRRVIL